MPYVDRLNRVCGFLDLEETENSCRFLRRYFILDTPSNALLWYMDNPQNLPIGACSVGSLKLTYISKVSEASLKQKPKTEFCFVINAVSRRYFLQANDAVDMKDWVAALNRASKITVPKGGPLSLGSEVTAMISDPHGGTRQQAYRTEIIGGVVVHTSIQKEGEVTDMKERKVNKPGVLRCGYCVKQGNVRKSWKRRFFTLDDNAVSYYKCETDKEPLRAIQLRDVQKVHECLVKSGDLLLRDNLFEIITTSRIFYVQTDSPEEMQGWIRDIEGKILDFRGHNKGALLKRSLCLYPGQNAEDSRPQLLKSCSVAPGWQPWTPAPQREAPTAPDTDEGVGPFRSLAGMPSHSCSSTSSSSSSSNSLSAPTPGPCPGPSPADPGAVFSAAPANNWSCGRRRHRSQPASTRVFPFILDEDGIRTTDV